MLVLLFGSAVPASAATETEINTSIENGLAWLATQQNGNGSFWLYRFLLADAASHISYVEWTLRAEEHNTPTR